jgi:hypothetical protein
MKLKFLAVALLSGLIFSSCKKQPCPAYGKTYQKIEKNNSNA